MARPQRIAVIMGTRPEAIKLAPVIDALGGVPNAVTTVIATGQHGEILRPIADQLGIPIDVDLGVMLPNQSLSTLTARLIDRLDTCLEQVQPDLALVQGDTTTMFVATLACFYRRVPVGHVEAGLRTADLAAPFPEEANRRLASQLVALHFAPTETAKSALVREGISERSVWVTGNTGIDALLAELERQKDPRVFEQADAVLSGAIGADWDAAPTVLVTVHRRESIEQGLEGICDAVATLARRFAPYRFVLPVHPNPNVGDRVRRRLSAIENVRLVAPIDYRAFVALLRAARLLLTDSGGIQEEAPSLRKPVLVLRKVTERPEGVQAGTAIVTGTDPTTIVDAASRLLTDTAAYDAMLAAENPYGDGRAAERIATTIRRYLSS